MFAEIMQAQENDSISSISQITIKIVRSKRIPEYIKEEMQKKLNSARSIIRNDER